MAELTLAQLAQKAGCSESLISKIERETANPSLATLHRLAAALNTNISDLTAEEAPIDRPVLRRGERPSHSSGDVTLERLVVPASGRLMQANIHIVPSGVESDGQIEHVGEEVGFVLEGTVELTLGDERYVLEAGDSFTFSSKIPHGYRNVGDSVARIIWVNTPATF